MLEKQPVRQIVITESHAGQRVDNFLVSLLKDVPKSYLYRIVRKGEVRVNKGRISINYRLAVGDTVRLPPIRHFSDEKILKPKPSHQLLEKLKKAICYEDENLIIINKPVGLAVHGGSGISLGLIEALRKMRPQAPFLELVHRLDRDTSGLLMVAKKRKMLLHLHECLKTGNIKKYYFALVAGKWKGGNSVDKPLLKYMLSGERRVKVDTEGKNALTRFKVVKAHLDFTLLEAHPITGRTHQIRVHCAYNGNPIIGDQKYGESSSGGQRLFLHAYKLVIKLPYEPYELIVTAPLPQVFNDFKMIQRKDNAR